MASCMGTLSARGNVRKLGKANFPTLRYRRMSAIDLRGHASLRADISSDDETATRFPVFEMVQIGRGDDEGRENPPATVQ
jgi:hypothetical protein